MANSFRVVPYILDRVTSFDHVCQGGGDPIASYLKPPGKANLAVHSIEYVSEGTHIGSGHLCGLLPQRS